MADTFFLPHADRLLDCLCLAIFETHPEASRPAYCCMRVGESVAQDAGAAEDLCCKGLAYVRTALIYPTGDTFPNPETDIAVTGCGIHAWGISLEMGIMRCVPTGTSQRPPSCDEWNAHASIDGMDKVSLVKALCCFLEFYDSGDIAVGQVAPFGPEGGCGGNVLGITVMVANTLCCEGA